MPRTFVHDPEEVLDYYADWASELGTDTIVAADCTSLDAAVTLSQTGIIGTITRFWATGGTAGTAVGVRTHVTTAAGRHYWKTQYLIIREK